jgi:hypothetical protein
MAVETLLCFPNNGLLREVRLSQKKYLSFYSTGQICRAEIANIGEMHDYS